LPANCTELELQTVAEAVVGRQPSSSYLVTDISDPIPPDIELLLGCFAVCCLLFCRRKQVHSSLNQLLRSRQASFIHDAVSCLSILCVCFFFGPPIFLSTLSGLYFAGAIVAQFDSSSTFCQPAEILCGFATLRVDFGIGHSIAAE